MSVESDKKRTTPAGWVGVVVSPSGSVVATSVSADSCLAAGVSDDSWQRSQVASLLALEFVRQHSSPVLYTALRAEGSYRLGEILRAAEREGYRVSYHRFGDEDDPD